MSIFGLATTNDLNRLRMELTGAKNPLPPVAPQPEPTPSVPSENPFTGANLYVNPNSTAAQWIATHPTDVNVPLLHKIAIEPTAVWLTGGTPDEVDKQVTQVLNDANGKLVTFVPYYIPNRDAGGQSAGGAANKDAYFAWCGAIDAAINRLGNPKAAFIYEPDALAFAWAKQNFDQVSTIQVGISILVQHPNRFLYLDVSMWNAPDATSMVQAVKFLTTQDGMKNVRGWALNVSGYNSDEQCHAFAQSLTSQVGGHYVVDTSRNGNGPAPAGQWENVPGMALGAKPLSQLGHVDSNFDANLWVKIPGESDGADNGAPSAGQFFYDRAVELAKNARS